MEELEELYQEIILDHSKHPRNYGSLAGASHSAEGHNPLCGDRLVLRLSLEKGVITKIAFEARGCAISKASASLMTESVKGKPKEQALELIRRALVFFRGEAGADSSGDHETEDPLSALAGVKKFPMRVKCATLAWHALESALSGKEAATSGPPVSTE